MDAETAAALARKSDGLGRVLSTMRRYGIGIDLLQVAWQIELAKPPKPITMADRVRDLVRQPGGALNSDVQSLLGVGRTGAAGYLSKMAKRGQAFGSKPIGDRGRALRWFGTADEAAAWAAVVIPGFAPDVPSAIAIPSAPKKSPVLHDVRAVVKSTAKATPGGRITLPGTNHQRGAKKPAPGKETAKPSKPVGEPDFSRAKFTRIPAAVDYRHAIDPAQAALSGGFAAEWQRLRSGATA